jgi:hypothetical protein
MRLFQSSLLVYLCSYWYHFQNIWSQIRSETNQT